MNLKTKLIGLALATAVSLGIAAPSVAADPLAPTTNLTISFNDSGTFSLAVGVQSGFTGGSVNAATGTTLGGVIRLTYTDDQAYRSQFRVTLEASDFVSNKQVPYSNPAQFYTIDNANLKLTRNRNPQQQRWSGMTPTPPYRVGDIGATTQTGTSIGNNPGVNWTGDNSLDTPRKVAQGWAGSGTVLTTHDIELELAVPAAMPAANYTSTLLATVVMETP